LTLGATTTNRNLVSEERDEQPTGGSVPPPAPAEVPDPADRRSHESTRPGPGAGTHAEARKSIFERTVPLIVKRVIERAVESGVEKLTELSEKPETLRNFVGDLRLPKEVLSDVYAQIDDTKNGLYRVVAKEIRDVLEQTQIAEEVAKVLTKLSFEIKTEIRFVPNDRASAPKEDAEDGDADKPESEGGIGGVRPKVTSEVTVKDRSGDKRRA
jgi:hypothetical protein